MGKRPDVEELLYEYEDCQLVLHERIVELCDHILHLEIMLRKCLVRLDFDSNETEAIRGPDRELANQIFTILSKEKETDAK